MTLSPLRYTGAMSNISVKPTSQEPIQKFLLPSSVYGTVGFAMCRTNLYLPLLKTYLLE